MADLKTLLKNAKQDAKDAQENVDGLDKVEQNIRTYDQNGKTAIANYIDQYPNAITSAMDENAIKLDQYTASIQDTSIRLQQKVEHAKSTLALLTKSADSGYMDVTSKRMMLDYAEEYKIAFLIICAKAVIVCVTMAFIYSRKNLFLTVATFVAVVVVWYSWNFILYFFQSNGGTYTEAEKLCADGTPANSTGSNCAEACTKSDDGPEEYTSCSENPFGCCIDGASRIDASGSACSVPLACMSTLYGCCPDGLMARTDASGSQCDWTALRGDCAMSKYGCCPNGITKVDERGSNCKPVSLCGITAFGCCPNGDDREDLAGSNCT
jgi:hypothetical protein